MLIILPLLFIFVFKYGAYGGLSIAFKNYKAARGFSGSEWVGFEIFQKIFSHRDFGRAVKNTLLINLLDLFFSFPAPIILALLLNEVRVKWFKKVTQTLLYLPHFLSWVIIGALAYQLFSLSNGVVNALIANAGRSPIPFLQEDAWWLVTLPCIRSTIVTLLIMNLGKLMQGSFERIYALYNAKASEYSTMIPVLVYRWGIESGKLSEATALGLFQSIIGLILVLLSDFIAKRLGEDGLI